jgi:glycosyltransferase
MMSTQSSAEKRVISEADDGIYDALNKGFALASGKYLGILHSDDVFKDSSVVGEVIQFFEKTDADIVYANVDLIDQTGADRGCVRPYAREKRKFFPDQVAHMGIFMKAEVARQLDPPFDVTYKIAADLKHQLLLFDNPRNVTAHFDRTVVTFRVGGYSTNSLSAYLLGLWESRRAWNEVRGWGGWLFVLSKILKRSRRGNKVEKSEERVAS